LTSNWISASETLYSEGGNLIATSLTFLSLPHLNLREPALILLASITPVLSLFHSSTTLDLINSILPSFFHYSQIPLTVHLITEISTRIIESLGFCLEQILDRLLFAASNFPSESSNRILFAVIPLLEALTLDPETRSVSHDTDVSFMRFSCVSLIERVAQVLAPLDINAEDSLSFVIWPSLAVLSGCEFLLLVLLSLARNSSEYRFVKYSIPLIIRSVLHNY
jgi:hypothetical protein